MTGNATRAGSGGRAGDEPTGSTGTPVTTRIPVSIYHRSELLLTALDGHVTEHAWGLCIASPKNPTYYFGNYLLLRGAPVDDEPERWEAIFRTCFSHEPRVNHVTIQWDQSDAMLPEATIAKWEARGFEAEHSAVLTARVDDFSADNPGTPPAGVIFRRLKSDADWAAVVEHQILCREEHFEETRYRNFKVDQFAGYRRLSEAGFGAWYGAFIGDTLVANLGLFGEPSGTPGRVFRYQMVETHPDHRRKGLCRALVTFAARNLVPTAEHSTATLVIAAEPDYHALPLYEGLGFVRAETHEAFCRSPDSR